MEELYARNVLVGFVHGSQLCEAAVELPDAVRKAVTEPRQV